MNFKFYQLYRSLKEVVGMKEAKRVFPEYDTFPDKLTKLEQVTLACELMDRLDALFDKETVRKIRRSHPCGIPKDSQEKINEIKSESNDDEARIAAYMDFLGGSALMKVNNEYLITWGLTSCVCGMFRNLKDYKPISPTWCECCNGHNKLLFDYLLDKEVSSELVSEICAGSNSCSFIIKF